MARKPAAPKRHADLITETVQLAPGIKRTYSAKLREHAIWIGGDIVATAHAVSIAWSIVAGNPDGGARRFGGLVSTEAEAIRVLENSARA